MKAMKRTLLLIVVLSLGGTPWVSSGDQNSGAARHFYLAFNTGVAWLDDLGFRDDGGSGKLKSDPGVRLDVAGGYQFTEWLALELQTGLVINTAHTTSDGESENSFLMTQMPILANVTCRIPLRSDLHPYLGVGVGGVNTSLENTSWMSNEQSGSDFVFGYQGFAGARYQFGRSMELGLEYKFMGTTEHQLENLEGTRCHSVALSFAIRF
jgi:opacity protein-like surface antigen